MSSRAATVVLTSSHVLATAGKAPIFLGFRVPDDEGNPLAALLDVRGEGRGRGRYVTHPAYDVGAFELQIPVELGGLIMLPSFIDDRALVYQRE